jgi:hypothetical protein
MNATVEEAVKAKKPKAEVEKVQMEDGRQVEFAGKRKMLKDGVFADGVWIGTRFDFRDGRTLNYDAPDPSVRTPTGEILRDQHACHGSFQKIGDETAGAKSVSEMYDAVEACIDRLNKAEWYVEGTGEGAFGTSVLARALALAYPQKSGEEIKVWLKSRTADEKKAMKTSTKLRPIIQRLEDEEAAKSAHVDTEELFGQLDAA